MAKSGKNILSGKLRSQGQAAPGATQDKLDALLAVARNNLVNVDEALITDAFHFAAYSHRNHIRKSGEPYFHHPYAVAMIVAQEIPLDDISVVSALLHDVLEDCPDEVTFDDIADRFGVTVAEIVDGATKITQILKNKEITKAENYRKLLMAMVNDIRVILVKFADRLHNMRTLQYVNDEQKKRISEETLDIYAPLAHRFGLGRIKWELEDLAFKYQHPEDYASLKQQVNQKRREREEYLARFTEPLKETLERAGFRFEITGRPKHLYSIYKKMQDRNKPIEEIYDLFAVRIILDTEDEKDCFTAYANVCDVYKPVPERYKNYISLPKRNDYKSIHSTVIGADGRLVEVQIRTRAMHEVSEKGIAAHWAYKENTSTNHSAFERWIGWVREILEQLQQTTIDEDGARQLVEDVRRNLFQEEIMALTPKGQIIVLPAGATPVDFAFEIHSEIGLHCIGAKVNGRIVPLARTLKNGDLVEIITSRNQFISTDWEQKVITNKARTGLKRFVNEQSRELIQRGKEKWERKLKKLKTKVPEEALQKAASFLRLQQISQLYLALGRDEVSVEQVLDALSQTPLSPSVKLPIVSRDPKQEIEKFAAEVSKTPLIIDGTQDSIQFEFARCCRPLPGDDVIGYVTVGHGLKIHRRSCFNIMRLLRDDSSDGQPMHDRLVNVTWPENNIFSYLGAIRMTGSDRPQLVKDISDAISSYQNTNIRSINLETSEDGARFNGAVLVVVKDLAHLEAIMARLARIPEVDSVTRLLENL